MTIARTPPVDLSETGFVITERSNGAFRQLTSHPVLHRATCSSVARTAPENVFSGSLDEPLARIVGWERACKRCCPDLVRWLEGGEV